MTITFVDIIDYLGTFAFAVSGIRLASAKKFDWFGAFIVGMATAVGGGTLRDVMLGQSPFWMTKPIYFAINGFALLLFVFLHKQINRVSNTIFLFDTIGLGDLQHFWAGETSADVSWSLGMYMSGFFPCMMFGIPGAALAMVKCRRLIQMPLRKTWRVSRQLYIL